MSEATINAVNESRTSTTTSEDDGGFQILMKENRNIHQPWYGICIFFYSILVVIAILGNSLVLIALGRSKELKKSARNILIGLLASSDLLLSCTMPLTAIDVLTKYWPFGKDTLNMCRTVKTSSAVAVYLSSMTLIAIAVDRHHCIVNSTNRQLSVNEAGLLAPVLLVISMLMATPIFFHTRVHDPKFGPPWSHVVYCVEDWSSSEEQSGEPEQRIYYSIFSMSMQYVIPFVSMALIYLKIFYYLKGHRMVRAERPQDRQKARRTNIMLFTISMVFCVAWLPLNLIGILLDAEADLFGDNIQAMILTFIACHLIGMSSACINPILYGYLNETFRKEFTAIAGPLKSCLKNKIPACIKSKCCCKELENEATIIANVGTIGAAAAMELQPLEINVQNGNAGGGSKVENKLIPRDPTSIEKKMDLITVHNVAAAKS